MRMLTRCEIARKDRFEIETGRHRFNSLFITLEGEYEYTVGNITKRVLPYQPVIFKKGTAFVKRVQKPVEFLIISLADFQYVGESWLSYEEDDRLRMESSVKHLKRAILQEQPDSVIEHFFHDILMTANGNADPFCDASTKTAYEYIQQNLDRSIPLSLLAQVSDCSVQTLISKFKRYYGKTPAKCMTDLRIKKAKELLLNTGYSVSLISEYCGYENVYYFSNVFKKETGISPLRFRQGYRL